MLTNKLAILKKFSRPGALALYKPSKYRERYYRLSRALHWRTRRARCLSSDYGTALASVGPYKIEHNLGYLKLAPGSVATKEAEAAIAEIRSRVNQTKLEEIRRKS